MAYTNAIFYMDYDLGVDTARADLVPSAYANNGSGLVRVTVGGLGTPNISTDGIVTIAGTTSGIYIGAWKVTVINSTTIDLQGSTYSSNPATKGSCVPSGGSSWADAWKTMTNGALSTRIAAGDTIRIAKSPAPTSIGHADWTNLSRTITLETAQNLNISLQTASWTANGAGDVITANYITSDKKEGAGCVQIAMDASPQASIMQAYYATGTLNLSGYQKITFWIKNNAAIIANNWEIKLCSDAAGATPVDSFAIPAIPSISFWVPITIARTGGGNLGASIQSIALYTGGTTTGIGSNNVMLDDFVACTTSGLNLQSLISKNTAEQGGTEAWHPIQSIDGTTIMIDQASNIPSGYGRGYYGTTEHVTTYIRETIKTPMTSATTTNIQQTSRAGALGSLITYKGGYNTSNSTQDGETWFDGLNGRGRGIAVQNHNYNTLDHLNACRYHQGFYATGSYITFTNMSATCCVDRGVYTESTSYLSATILCVNNNGSDGCYFLDANFATLVITSANNNNSNGFSTSATTTHRNTITITDICNNASNGILFNGKNNTIVSITNASYNGAYGISLYGSSSGVDRNTFNSVTNVNNNGTGGIAIGGNGNRFYSITHINNNTGYAIYLYSNTTDNYFSNVSTSGNTSGAVYRPTNTYRVTCYFFNATFGEATKITDDSTENIGRIYSTHEGGDINANYIYVAGSVISTIATDRTGGTGLMWKFAIANAARVYNPATMPVAKIAVTANNLVTVSLWMKKDHATNVSGTLRCRAGQIAWSETLTEDIIGTCPDDTNWNQVSITFTPTENGVVEIDTFAYYVAGNSNVYIEDITITQA
jgi:hypothetical protein